MLDLLPVETVLEILSYLPLATLHALPLLSKEWLAFFKTHELPIYYSAALQHRFISATVLNLPDLHKTYADRSLKHVDSWKALCRTRFQVESSWEGQFASRMRMYRAVMPTVHRIKVDEMAGFMITTHRDGGLSVTDIESDEILWTLPTNYVLPFAHCEYSHGFLIFNRWESKEIWRLESDFGETTMPADVSRDEYQQYAYEWSKATFGTTTTRGHFKPWAILLMQEPTRAFRLVYPTFLTVSRDRAFLYNVETAQLVQTIDNIQSPDFEGVALGDINYVELSEKYVFICGTKSLKLYYRSDGKPALCVPSWHSGIAACSASLDSSNWATRLSPSQHQATSELLPQVVTVSRNSAKRRRDSAYRDADEFIAAHVSSCGRHLVALRENYGLVLFRDFQRAIRGEVPLKDLAIEVDYGTRSSESKYLACENGKVTFAIADGIFVITLDPEFHHLREDASRSASQSHRNPSVFDRLKITRAARFADRSSLGVISCLQMTDTGIWFTWSLNGRDSLITVGSIDVSPVEDTP